jgi:hypothetical protein
MNDKIHSLTVKHVEVTTSEGETDNSKFDFIEAHHQRRNISEEQARLAQALLIVYYSALTYNSNTKVFD